MRITPIYTSQNTMNCKKNTAFSAASPLTAGRCLGELQDFAKARNDVALMEQLARVELAIRAKLLNAGNKKLHGDFSDGLRVGRGMSDEDIDTFASA